MLIFDTGPLLALLNSRDRRHEWIHELLKTVPSPAFTCEAVIVETCFLLGRGGGRPLDALELVSRGLLRCDFRMDSEIDALRTLMHRFADVPMSLADACLVRMSEIEPKGLIVTFDNDFRVYRKNRNKSVPTIMPE